LHLALTALLGFAACAPEAETPPLGPEERALVDSYVRLTVLQALHEREPDSTRAELRHLSAEVDTTALHRALERLAEDPLRWELIYAAIAARLEELESTPALWWPVVRGDSLLPVTRDSTQEAVPLRVPIQSERAPDR
jgi:hypothetical protein